MTPVARSPRAALDALGAAARELRARLAADGLDAAEADARAQFAATRALLGWVAGEGALDDDARALARAAGLAAHAPDEALRALRPRSSSDDPLLHAYERLLAVYDPSLRRARGVFYTPRPVVRFLARAVDALLRDELGLAAGLAHPRVTVFDPAAGTGTFLFEAHALAAKSAHGGAAGAEGAGARFVGTELLAVPHALALARARRVGDGARFALHRGDAFDALDAVGAPAARACDALVVLGNPPYAARSRLAHPAAAALLDGLDPRDGAPVAAYRGPRSWGHGSERNPKWLNDDYVKFLRLAQWHLERAPRGVLAFVLPHGLLDQATFAPVRAALREAFDALYALDLHGDFTRRERAPDGGRDENVFRVRSGLCLLLGVRRGVARVPAPAPAPAATVHRADRYGPREDKLRWLDETPFANVPWRALRGTTLAQRFDDAHGDAAGLVASDDARARYASFVPLDELFPVRASCVLTGADGALVRFAPTGLGDAARPVLYRPFDRRWILDVNLVQRPRRAVFGARWASREAGEPMLLARRQSVPGQPAAYVFASRWVPVDGVLRSDNRGTECAFLLRDARGAATTPEALRERFARGAGLAAPPSPEALLAYVYAVLHAPGYRARYGALHAEGFPRVPLPRDAASFAALGALGAALLALHTTLPEALAPPAGARFVPGARSEPGVAPVVGPLRYDAEARALVVKGAGAFEGVPAVCVAQRVGSYLPAFKWLRDRAGEPLTEPLRRAYLGVLGALAETAALEAQLAALEGAEPYASA